MLALGRSLTHLRTLIPRLQHRSLATLTTGGDGIRRDQFTLEKTFSQEETRQFLHSTGDRNPIHVDETSARKAGFPGPILPGILLASLFPAIIGTQFPGAVYATQTLAFKKPALVGEAVLAEVTVSKVSGRRVLFDTRCYSLATPTQGPETPSGKASVETSEKSGTARLSSTDSGTGGQQRVLLVEGAALCLMPAP